MLSRRRTALPAEVDVAIELVPELERQGRKKNAQELFDRLFALHEKMCADYPKSAWAHNTLAWLAARCQRQLEKALAHAETAVKLEPKDTSYKDTLAEVHFQRGETDKAVELMKTCTEANPKNAYYRKQLERYATAVGSERAMLGLYFPLLKGWREWAREPG